jgi:methane monooxygenase component A beta chain/propane monooxygenase small subunit
MTETPAGDESRSRAIGHREFTWFTPCGRHPTDYENLTVGQQSSPAEWLHVGWPVRFDDGRDPFTEDSTRVRSCHWRDWRDPFQVWQRPYVQNTNFEEQALEHVSPVVLDTGLRQINKTWLHEILGRYYAAWPFAEYGLFLALCYAVREALADTIIFATAYETTDKLRHQQDIVRLILEIGDRDHTYSDAGARGAWLEDPILVPIRENIERIFSLNDWTEILVAINLVFEPLAGRLVKDEFVARNAPLNGDPLTPVILATARRDTARHLGTTKSLVDFLTSDPQFGDENRRIISGWVERWSAESSQAAKAAAGLFGIEGISLSRSGSDSLDAVTADHSEIVTGLGLN